MGTVDPDKTHVQIGSIARTGVIVAAIFGAGWWVRGSIGSYDAQLKNVSENMVSKADLETMKKACIKQCTADTLATLGEDGMACFSLPLRGENFRRCKIRSTP